MTKLSKGLTLVGGGVPAVAILSACVLNAYPHAPHAHLAADTIGSTKPSTPEAMVQPKSLDSPSTGPDTPLSDLARQAKPVKSAPQETRKATTRHSLARHAKADPKTLTQAQKQIAAKVVAYAKAQLGTPYVFGGESPQGGFDCSGLVMAAYHAAGVNVPRTSDTQYWFGKRIAAGTERPGDLVFFNYEKGHTGPGHVGIVVDPAKGLMIVAPHTGTVVKYQNYRTFPGGPVGFTRPTLRPDIQHKIAKLVR